MSSVSEKDKYHRAARDGFQDILREATRKDCNAQDEDGLTPTLWAAYYGHLDVLRVLVGRGGDPDKCDFTGNTALHWSASNGHINCVSFLVNFGVNLWSLNNDFHTAKDCAASTGKSEILDFLDTTMAKQSALNPKMVQKQKEKAITEAEKRIKAFEKIAKKASKKAEKEEKSMEKFRKKLLEPICAGLRRESSVSTTTLSTLNGTLGGTNGLAAVVNGSLNSAPKFSDIVNNGTMNNKIRGFGGVSRKVLLRKQHSDSMSNSVSSEFKVRDIKDPETGKKSLRSLTGLRRGDDVLYVRKYNQINNSISTERSNSSHHIYASIQCTCDGVENGQDTIKSANGLYSRPHLRDLFRTSYDDSTHFGSSASTGYGTLKSNLHRTVSEPDFSSHMADSGLGDDLLSASPGGGQTTNGPPQSSIFERPGFGSVSFRHSLLSSATLLGSINGKGSCDSGSNSSGGVSHNGSSTLNNNNNNNNNTITNNKHYATLESLRETDIKTGNGNCDNTSGANGAGSDSIGSAGSLAQRNATLSVMSGATNGWDEDGNTLIGDQLNSSPMDVSGHDRVGERIIKAPAIVLFLAAHGLLEYAEVFQKEKIDLEALALLNENDLKSLGLPLGPRRKLMLAIERRRLALQEADLILESVDL